MLYKILKDGKVEQDPLQVIEILEKYHHPLELKEIKEVIFEMINSEVDLILVEGIQKVLNPNMKEDIEVKEHQAYGIFLTSENLEISSPLLTFDHCVWRSNSENDFNNDRKLYRWNHSNTPKMVSGVDEDKVKELFQNVDMAISDSNIYDFDEITGLRVRTRGQTFHGGKIPALMGYDEKDIAITEREISCRDEYESIHNAGSLLDLVQ
ncbi:hypothetical protein ACFL1H_01255 [Nanoarchaeota archaeon]